MRTFYEFQRRYKSNKRNRKVPRFADCGKQNRKLLMKRRLQGGAQVTRPGKSGSLQLEKGCQDVEAAGPAAIVFVVSRLREEAFVFEDDFGGRVAHEEIYGD